ncbi:PREDICTED: cytochrome P450 89A2-like [Populus euphratica]|uniref:Cytochrome P450 89A2-like n=1 Tax=Populus euphratica TaxID=75702 RepID=A0AAJ6X512_POPEU|nr:PREDICTED: cytochrome P450 89A2-like [Populus euphratica]
MESWFLVLVSISISLFLKIIFNNFLTSKNLPPGPLTFPFIGHLLWLRMSAFKMEPILRSLHAKFGPMVTLRIGTRPAIFVADRTLAHEALIHGGAVFADRPPAVATRKIMTSNQQNISSSAYGPTWRLLRRNLTAEILHPSRVKSYTHARNWVLQILQNRFESQAKAGRPICVMEHFQYAMFCLLVLMCFGDKLDENQIKKIMEVQRQMIVNFGRFNILNLWPGVTKIVLRNRWRELFRLRKCQEDVLIPLIRARKKAKEESVNKSKEDKKDYEDEYVLSYVDTILALELPEEKRKLNEEEMVSLCSEFLNGGTDTTSTALQWIMANLVKYPQIQEKLFMEIKGVVQDGEENIKEEELQKMPYLKAIILEGLRRHPPGHFALPHAVTEDVVLGKYVVPKDGTINFMVAEMGWNPKVWEDPMVFKPERFLNSGGETFDITGSREIKMMPFGAGRRICPAYGLAILHLEYFVANLIWRFEWKAVDGDDVDLSEKEEFTVVMKNPLQAQICPRLK